MNAKNKMRLPDQMIATILLLSLAGIHLDIIVYIEGIITPWKNILMRFWRMEFTSSYWATGSIKQPLPL